MGSRNVLALSLATAALLVLVAGASAAALTPQEQLGKSLFFDTNPWAPQQKVLVSVRDMSSENTARKFDVKPYLAYVSSLPTIEAVRRGEPANPGR